ncbi:hypothetical protein GCM10027321_20270 [Massilia terrae]|uniref:DUF3566 domain-containing protein n=1 Tax=Massilia terrae TaxID=1811224 RepID=A0ABT2CXP0_9BURK|nr:DUF3566 domain-containing protein [Massilia terrae]MCS0657965.1 DUF3566 domain-containing protein [Massilia terrae]
MITKQVVNISALQYAKVAAAVNVIIAVPYAFLLQYSMPEPWVKEHLWLFILAVAVAFIVVGSLFCLIGAWVYNIIAARIGGFEFTIAEIGQN